MRRVLELTVLLFTLLAGPASADVSLTATRSATAGGFDAVYAVTGTAGDDVLRVEGAPGSVTFGVPDGAVLTVTDPDGLCTVAGQEASCPASPSGATAAGVDLGDGSDTVTSPTPITTTFPVTIDGGDAVDRLDLGARVAGVTANASTFSGGAVTLAHVEDVTGSAHDDTLSGFPGTTEGADGDDLLIGGGGAETLSGGPGDDVLRGGAGADTLAGGTGVDTATYQDRTDGITASLDGVANDGAPGEGDAIAGDVERLTGGNGADTLVGDGQANLLRGGPGDDALQGGLGQDRLEGGDGADTLRDAGGIDLFFGDAGDDAIFAKDEFGESVYCGDGQDTAELNDSDSPDACESATGLTPMPYALPIATPIATPGPAAVRKAAGKLKLRRKGARLRKRTIRTRSTARCAAAAACRLKVVTKVGTGTRKLAAGKTARITLKLTKKAARKLRRAGKRKLTFTVSLSAPGAKTVKHTVKATVRA